MSEPIEKTILVRDTSHIHKGSLNEKVRFYSRKAAKNEINTAPHCYNP